MKTFKQFLEQRDHVLYESIINEGIFGDAWNKTKNFFGEFYNRLKDQFGEFSEDAIKIKKAYDEGKLKPPQIEEINKASKAGQWWKVAKILATIGIIGLTALSVGAGHAHAGGGSNEPLVKTDKSDNTSGNSDNTSGSIDPYFLRMGQNYSAAYNKTYQIGPEVYKKMKEHEKDIESFLKEAGAGAGSKHEETIESIEAIKNIANDIVQDLVRENPSGDYLNRIPSFKDHQKVKEKGIFQIDSPYESLIRSIESIKDLYLKNHPERKSTWDKIDGNIMLHTTLNYIKD